MYSLGVELHPFACSVDSNSVQILGRTGRKRHLVTIGRFLALAVGVLFFSASAIHAEEHLIAIDVLLQPDSVMLEQASTWNALMREQSPEGFKLDEEHAPHITLIQRFVSESDLASVLAAVDRVRSMADTSKMQMRTTGLYHIPSGKIGLAGIVVEPSSDLIALQQAMIEAVNPFARPGGEASAFVPDPTGAAFDPMLFKYVETFVPSQTGEKFNPHVTIGIAPLGWLEQREKQPFNSFAFGAKGIAVYQLGNFGTASKRLDDVK